MIGRDGAGDTETWLPDLPATSRQRWSALAVATALLLTFAILVPFTAVPLPRIDAFIPSLEATAFERSIASSPPNVETTSEIEDTLRPGRILL